MKKLNISEIKAEADKIINISEFNNIITASWLQRLATVHCQYNGFYSFTYKGKKIFVESDLLYSVDNQNPYTFKEIVDGNDLETISINQISKLEINESCYIGIVEIKRLS